MTPAMIAAANCVIARTRCRTPSREQLGGAVREETSNHTGVFSSTTPSAPWRERVDRVTAKMPRRCRRLGQVVVARWLCCGRHVLGRNGAAQHVVDLLSSSPAAAAPVCCGQRTPGWRGERVGQRRGAAADAVGVDAAIEAAVGDGC